MSGGIRFPSMRAPSPAIQRVVLILLVMAASLATAWVVIGARASATESVAANVACDVTEQVYGTAVSCVGEGGVSLLWPDGTTTETSASTTPRFVGDAEVVLLDAFDARVAAAPLRVTPDIDIRCGQRDEELRKVFELEHTELRSQGWDYVYRDTATGDAVRPGDPRHPSGGPEDGLERVLLSEAYSTGLCSIVSTASDDLADTLPVTYSMVIESPWESAQTTTMRIIGPSSKTQWAGVQPAILTGTVTINNVTASERTDVYQSGCS